MKLNVKAAPIQTHEGATAQHINAEQQLRRSVMCCMLWEDQFYEDGQAIAARIAAEVVRCEPAKVAAIAIEAREQMKLRHAPLLIVREMARLPGHKALVAKTLAQVIQRPDELTEFLAIYWKEKRQPLSAQVKKGLAAAFTKFGEYALAKYSRDGAVKLRDVLFLSHSKPTDGRAGFTKLARQTERRLGAVPKLADGEALYRKVVDNTLATPDTWEVALSAGEDKKGSFLRLIAEKKLGALALLRNLRNMEQAGIEKAVITEALATMNAGRVLPFRFIAAARAVPQWEDVIEPVMLRCLDGAARLAGKTILLVDVSGSMDAAISQKSDLRRLDAACGLAILLREVCAEVAIATFSNALVAVPPRRGFALRDAIVGSQQHSGTYLGKAVTALAAMPRDRIIVITDEQSADAVPQPQGTGYMLNVASAKNGVGYGAWTHIDGWSESVVDYIVELEGSRT